jgi:hypothetical protein
VHAVSGDEIVGPDGLRPPRLPVMYDGGDTTVVHLERVEFRPVTHLCATPSGLAQQDRLGLALRAILHGRLWAELVQAGEDPVEVDGRLFVRTVKRRLGHQRGDLLGDRVDLVAHAKAAQDLQAAKAQVPGLRINEHLEPLLDQQRAHPVLAKQRGGRQAPGTGANDEHRDPLNLR